MVQKQDTGITQLLETLSNTLLLPKEAAHAMPVEYYTSPEFLELETDEVLRKEWMCIGHVGEVREPGDFFTTELVDEQLIVTRGMDDGIIRVLSNVCRHRGNRVAEGAGNTRKFICRYHTWSYDTTGSLVAAPLMKGQIGFNKEKCGLPEFASEIWNGWIFVNLSGSATPLSPRLEGLSGIVKNYHPDDRFLVFMEEDVWGCNWKCLFENFMEGYHLSSIHFDTLHPMTPTKLCKKMKSGEGWTGYHAYYDPSYPPRGPFHPDLTEDECNNSPMYGIYPNLVVGMATNFTLFMCLRPYGAGKVKIRWGVTGLEDAPDSQKVKDYVDLCRAFNVEDKEKLETLQQALKTRHYECGPLAPDDFEGTIWDFTRYMARLMSQKS